MYVLVATYLPSAALRGSGLVARALLRADLFEKKMIKEVWKGAGPTPHDLASTVTVRLNKIITRGLDAVVRPKTPAF